MLDEPLVSVAVVTFNHKDYIKKCLDGILEQQTRFPFEIILGEDQSIDGTREICQDYANKYPDKIRLFLRNREDVIYINGNPTGRFNFIENLKQCKGKYIALCEGDDYWTDPLKLQKQVDLLEANPQWVACHHWQKIALKRKGKFIEVDSPKSGHGYLPQSQSKVIQIFSNKLRVKTRTVMFRNIINDGFFPKWFAQVAFGDVPLSFLLGKHGDFGFIDEEMAVYRQTGEGISTAGLKELGEKKFNIQHYKNWIQIWDYANRFYSFKYHKEASKTVLYFYNNITTNLPITVGSFMHVLSYNIFERKLPFWYKIGSSKWIVFYYLKMLSYKLKRKITKL